MIQQLKEKVRTIITTPQARSKIPSSHPSKPTNTTKTKSTNHNHLPKQGPPYPPQGAGLGGQPTVSVDIPISAVLAAIFLASAILNMTIFQRNRRRGHKFVLSALLFGFSMARLLANIMRIVWAAKPRDAQIAIAAGVLTNAGVILLFIVNLILVQRVLRAYHPTFGWSKPATFFFQGLYFCIGAALIMVIVAVVYSFYTLDMDAKQKIRDVQLFAVVFLAVLSFLPIPIAILALVWPKSEPADPFGSGASLRTKAFMIIFTATLLALGASFRAGTAFYMRPASNPAWFHSKACYYCFIYLVEVISAFTYTLGRFDRLFHIPDGSSAPGDYSRKASNKAVGRGKSDEEAIGEERPPTAAEERTREEKWEEQLQNELNSRQ